MTDYDSTISFLFNSFPVFQHSGSSAYKPGLDNALALAQMMNNPQKCLNTIHIAGTNGKGSTAHTIAAVLQCAGLRTGLFTSPHLVDFRERIRINGQMIPKDYVVDLVDRFKAMKSSLKPSFFEFTTIMAFEWFARNEVDIAVIETGLGGRLDTTNIITPILSIITNISLDHTALLGDTLEKIASEKAGIIKPGIPVVIGEASPAIRRVFIERAKLVNAPIIFAEDEPIMEPPVFSPDFISIPATPFGDLKFCLTGNCQVKNAATIIVALRLLLNEGLRFSSHDVRRGFAEVCSLTGLMGRWTTISTHPFTICDTGHNVGGWQYIIPRLAAFPGKIAMVIGFVNDKDVSSILNMIRQLSSKALFFFTKASVERALPSSELMQRASAFGLQGRAFDSVAAAYEAALAEIDKGSDMIFVGGSTFVVADFLRDVNAQR